MPTRKIIKKRVVIVGGGTAGLVIANNLQDYCNVTVVDKCQFKRYPLIYGVPMMIGLLFKSQVLKYILKKEFTLRSGRKIPFFESNVLGGASPINGCVHTVGNKTVWGRILKKYSSAYIDLMSSYEKLYAKQKPAGNHITLALAPQNIIDALFARVLDHDGIPSGDMNFSDHECHGPIYNTRGKVLRTSVLSLIKNRRFKVKLNEKVQHLRFDANGKVSGVVTDKSCIPADCVVLAAGVIGTCRVLLNEENCSSFLKKVKDLKVGQGLQDHTNLRVNVIAKTAIGSLNEVSQSFYKNALMLLKHCLGVPTLMRGTGATSGVHLDLDKDGIVETRIHVVQFSETGRHGSDGKYFSDEPGFSLSITPIAPESRGEIRLYGEHMDVDPNYLGAPRDIETLRLALNFCLKLLRTEPFADIVKEIVDEKEIEEAPERYIFNNFFSGHHLIGGSQHAVGTEFNVKGVDGLYICDASVIPEYPASNIHSSVVLLSDIFSKKFLLQSDIKDLEQ